MTLCLNCIVKSLLTYRESVILAQEKMNYTDCREIIMFFKKMHSSCRL